MLLYHLAPREFRTSIRREGLRRHTFFNGRLVLWAALETSIGKWSDTVALKHECIIDDLDRWQICIAKEHCQLVIGGSYVVTKDVLPIKVSLV
jgi:hypothetical protein